MSNEMSALWHRVVKALGPAGETLKPRAGLTNLGEVEAALGLELPDEYRAWLAVHDGEEAAAGRVDYLPAGGTRLLPAAVTVERWRANEEWFQPDGAPGFEVFQDEDRIRNVVFHARRVMIASNAYGDGDNLYLDLCPGPRGAVGQVIVAVTECDFEVVGASFGDFLRRLATALEDGLLEVRPGAGGGRVVARGTAYGRWESVLRAVAPR